MLASVGGAAILNPLGDASAAQVPSEPAGKTQPHHHEPDPELEAEEADAESEGMIDHHQEEA